MTEIVCRYPDRDEHLVAYVYDDIDSAERTSFGAHLAACRSCQEDLSALRGVRPALSTWAPPEPAFARSEKRAASREPREARSEPRAARWWHDVPAWAQVAAALFVLGISATIANLDVRYDRSGLAIRTGWSKPQPVPASADSAALRAEISTVAAQLRAEIDAKEQSASAVRASLQQTPAISETELRRRVQMLLDERETRIQNEIALAVANVMKDYQQMRMADLAKIERSIGYVQATAQTEQLKQREAVNYLLKVSQSR
jgi:anti-sigma factor RsiW